VADGVTIPAALRDEIAADLAAGGERAKRWHPRAIMGVTWILALDGPYVGSTGTSTGLAGWEYSDDGTHSGIFISADDGGPWQFDLDEMPQAHSVTAWAPVGAIDRPRGMDLQARNPRPVEGDRILVLTDAGGDCPEPWIGHVTYASWGNLPVGAVMVGDSHLAVQEGAVTRWAILPRDTREQT
jgi:hypothetical protein